ncbi:17429_t:CDS:2, partial [Entrophospora sp. SA101]
MTSERTKLDPLIFEKISTMALQKVIVMLVVAVLSILLFTAYLGWEEESDIRQIPQFSPSQSPLPSSPFNEEYKKPQCNDVKAFQGKPLTGPRTFRIREFSKKLCPYPPELVNFFEHLFEKHVKPSAPSLALWPKGYAPCHFWTEWLYYPGEYFCGGQKYTWTANYTEWRDIDIVFVDAVYWLGIDQPPFYDIMQLPPRTSKQAWWLYFSGESLAYYPFIRLESFQELFDMSAGSPARLFDFNQPTHPIQTSDIPSFYKTHVPFDKKRSDVLIAWMATNCSPRNNRNEFVQSLMNLTIVHSFGKCLHTQDFPNDILVKYGLKNGRQGHFSDKMAEIKRDVLSPYKFILALENSNCEGYVTEKVYDPMLIDAIPIYMGASDIDDYIPPRSVIKVSDYKTIEELVAYVKKVADDPALFASYFAWKNDTSYQNFCKNCHSSTESVFCRMLDRIQWKIFKRYNENHEIRDLDVDEEGESIGHGGQNNN